MTATFHDVLIVGAGHAGAQAAIALRQGGFEGSIALLGDEPHPPYDRPALSKEYLAGDRSFDRMLLRPAAFWDERGIHLLTGRRVTTVEPGAKTVGLADDTSLAYGTLIWATGGAARRLTCPGHDLAGVQVIRSRADIDGIRSRLDRVRHVVVIGGGYIGLESAAVLVKLDKRVTVLEAQDRVLARVAGEPLSRFYEAEHRAHGVDVRLGTTVARIEGRDGSVCGVRLDDGEMLACDMVIVGIGITPAIEPLLAAGAACGNGVLVDDQCRTSLVDIYATGDCAAHANRHAAGAVIRLESVQNASDQAKVVARTIMGEQVRYDAVPWFWSSQYDLKLQTVGLSSGHDAAVLRGDPAGRSFSVIYLRGGRAIAIDCVNATRDYVQGRALVIEGARVDPACLGDMTVPLKSMAHPQADTARPTAAGTASS